ncbi:MAG: DUF3592 domain-containing protein [Coriobacteriia bacterium]|nr:DUF3592 domain-containing protein [Coriobacteriia bacterium]
MDFLTIFLIISLIALAIFTFVIFRHIKKKQNIPRLETEGVLTKITMAKYRGEETGFYVKYKVDGKEYLAILGDAGAKNIFKTTPVGTKVTVLYNPDNPQDAYAELRDLN